jgi:hypothetical protein
MPMTRAAALLALAPSAAVAQTFRVPVDPFFATVLPAALAAVDFDGDGDVDVLAASPFGWLELHDNDGEGRFTVIATAPIAGYLGTTRVTALTVVDVDGDADPDVVLAMRQTSPCGFPDRLVRNLGNGTLPQTPLNGTANETMQVAPLDFDGDGDADLLQVVFHNNVYCNPMTSRLLRNDGSGAFTDVTAAVMPAAPLQRRSAAIVDLQGDGRPDVVFDGNVVFTNNGTQLVPAAAALPVALSAVRAADVDGDGDTDLYGVSAGATVLLRNAGGGSFVAATGPPLPAPGLEVFAADVDGDGDRDLLTTCSSYPQPPLVRLWRHDPGPTFVDVTAAQLPFVPGAFHAAVFADADGDGDVDLLLGGAGVLHNDGTGRFVTLARQPTPVAGRASDIDGDGDADVVAVAPGGAVAWWRNVANEFVLAGTVLTGPQPTDAWLVTFDADGDGDDDVLAVRSTAALARNDGGGSFTDVSAATVPPFAITSSPVQKVVAADFDGDGDVDLFLARGTQYPASPQDALWQNDGTGTFTDVGPTHFVDAHDTLDAVAIDFDRDGDLDLAVVNQTATGPLLRLFANDGSARFTDVTAAHLPAAPAWEVLAVDVDGDLDADLVLGRGSMPAQLLRNDAGVFNDASSSLAPHTYSNVPLATDVDDDGDPDLMLGGQWLLNDGSGTFAASAAPGMFATAFADEQLFADVDDDGDPDWLGWARNLHRQVVDALPPRLGLHAELALHAQPAAAGPAAALLLLGAPGTAPIALGALGRLHLDPTGLALHSLQVIPATGPATVRYLCPSSPALLGTVLGAQALFLHGAVPAQWRLGNAITLRVLL